MVRIFTILPFAVFAAGCEKIETFVPSHAHTYTVESGENIFKPVLPIEPMLESHLDFDVAVGKEWWSGNLTNPAGFGCKLNGIGKFNYHDGGANFAIYYDHGEVYLEPRYYEPITEGTYKLHELTQFAVKMAPDVKYKCNIILSEKTDFYVDGKLVASAPVKIPETWICQPFLGRSGNDNNYPGGPIPGAFATRKLSLKITRY